MNDDISKTTKPRCPECGGTGIRLNEQGDTAICLCPAGKARERANEGSWD